MKRPPEEDRPDDPKIPGATHHLDDQTATRRPGSVHELSAQADGGVAS